MAVTVNMFVFVVLWIYVAAEQPATKVFSNLYDEFWNWRKLDNPEFANNIGDHEHTDMLENYTIAAIDVARDKIRKYYLELQQIDKYMLSEADQVSYEVLKDTLQTWLDGYHWRYYGPMNPVNSFEGIQSNFQSRLGDVKFETENDFRKFAKRIGLYGDRIMQEMERMNKSIEMRTTYHNVSVRNISDRCDAMLKYLNNITAFPMYEPFRNQLDNIVNDTRSRADLRAEAEKQIRYLLDRVQVLKEYMQTTYMPNTRTDLGVVNLPQGKEYYQACLRWHLSINVTAEEIHDIGLKQVEDVSKEIRTIMTKAQFNGTITEYLEKLRNDPSLIVEPGKALQMFKDIYNNRIKPKLGKLFLDIPIFPLVIEPMLNAGPMGIYKNGAPDKSRPGKFLANVQSKVQTFDMMALLLHETDPGHHLQDSYALMSQSIPMFRKATDFSKYFSAPLHFPFYTAYSEGWGLYSEDLGKDLDLFENNFEWLGKHMLDIFRAARLVVDTGIHAKGWNKTQAVGYMLNYTCYSQELIEREVDRYATWPGQATAYMIGKLKIRELRTKAEHQLGNKFDIRHFHKVILTNGAMPLYVMEKLVDRWILDVQNGMVILGSGMDNQVRSLHTAIGPSMLVLVPVISACIVVILV